MAKSIFSYGIIDSNGEEIIPCEYSSIESNDNVIFTLEVAFLGRINRVRFI